MRVCIEKKMTVTTKMVTTMEDMIYEFEKIWFYTGNDAGNR